MSLFFIYKFYFENLIYKQIKQFENQQKSDYFLSNVLVRVKVVFLPDYYLVLSLIKHMDVGAFLNQKNEDPKPGKPFKWTFKGLSLFGMDTSLGPKFFYTLCLSKEKNSKTIR